MVEFGRAPMRTVTPLTTVHVNGPPIQREGPVRYSIGTATDIRSELARRAQSSCRGCMPRHDACPLSATTGSCEAMNHRSERPERHAHTATWRGHRQAMGGRERR
jgi:hypothetical protein